MPSLSHMRRLLGGDGEAHGREGVRKAAGSDPGCTKSRRAGCTVSANAGGIANTGAAGSGPTAAVPCTSSVDLAHLRCVWPEARPAVSKGQHRRNARCTGARTRRDASTGTFPPGVLMRSRVQSHRLLAFQRQHGCCCYCGVPMWLHAAAELPAAAGSPGGAHELRCTAEHLVPRSNGGTDRLENIAAACARCNHTRHRRKRPPPPRKRAAEAL